MSQKLVACFFQICAIQGIFIFIFFIKISPLALRNINAVYQLKKLIELYFFYQIFDLVDMKVIGALNILFFFLANFTI